MLDFLLHQNWLCAESRKKTRFNFSKKSIFTETQNPRRRTNPNFSVAFFGKYTNLYSWLKYQIMHIPLNPTFLRWTHWSHHPEPSLEFRLNLFHDETFIFECGISEKSRVTQDSRWICTWSCKKESMKMVQSLNRARPSCCTSMSQWS